MHFEFKLKNSAAGAALNIYRDYGNNTVCKHTVQRWYQKFNSGDESLENEPRGRPASMIEDNVLNTCIEGDMSQTSRELAKRIGVSYIAIFKHFHAIWKVRKMDKWVPFMSHVISAEPNAHHNPNNLSIPFD